MRSLFNLSGHLPDDISMAVDEAYTEVDNACDGMPSDEQVVLVRLYEEFQTLRDKYYWLCNNSEKVVKVRFGSWRYVEGREEFREYDSLDELVTIEYSVTPETMRQPTVRDAMAPEVREKYEQQMMEKPLFTAADVQYLTYLSRKERGEDCTTALRLASRIQRWIDRESRASTVSPLPGKGL